MPRVPGWTVIDADRSLRRTLSPLRTGAGDPTTRLSDGEFLRAFKEVLESPEQLML